MICIYLQSNKLTEISEHLINNNNNGIPQ